MNLSKNRQPALLQNPKKIFVILSCGDDGVRTRDLVVANHALSQLSYIPVSLRLQWAYLDSNQGPQLYQSCALAN